MNELKKLLKPNLRRQQVAREINETINSLRRANERRARAMVKIREGEKKERNHEP